MMGMPLYRRGAHVCPRHWPDERCTADCHQIRRAFRRLINEFGVYWRERARGMQPKRLTKV